MYTTTNGSKISHKVYNSQFYYAQIHQHKSYSIVNSDFNILK